MFHILLLDYHAEQITENTQKTASGNHIDDCPSEFLKYEFHSASLSCKPAHLMIGYQIQHRNGIIKGKNHLCHLLIFLRIID